MNAIEIVLTGVVYLLGPKATSEPVDVIIPNLSMPSAPYSHVLVDHYAYVKVRTADIQSCTAPCLRAADFLYKEKVDKTEFALYALHGDQISLSGGNLTPKPLEICTKDDCGKKLSEGHPGESDQLVSYHTIPAQAYVCKTCGPARSEYLTSTNGDLVAARMKLDRGTLSAANRDTVEWRFLPARFKFASVDYHHQLVADQAVLSAEADGDVTLIVKPLTGDPEGFHTVNLVLKKTAQIEVGNLMPGDVVPMGHHAPEAVDIHFAAFYRMMSDPVPSDPPIPHRTVFPDADPGGPRANCVPLRGSW